MKNPARVAAAYSWPGRHGVWEAVGRASPAKEERTLMTSDGHDQDGQAGPAGQDGPAGSAGPPPSRRDRRLYLMLMTVCIGLFVLSWAVLDRYSTAAAIAVSAVALVIPPFAVIIANAASATDRRR